MVPTSDTKERICKAATELFAHYGYAKTSLDDIAARALIGKATIYYHFASKEDLFIDAVSDKAEELFHSLSENIEAAPDFSEKLAIYLKMPMKYIYENLPILAEALNQIGLHYIQRLEENRSKYKDRMTSILKTIINEGKNIGVVREDIDTDRFSEVINEWFLMGDTWIDSNEKERVIQRMDRDHELIINILLNGIVIK